MSPSSDMHGFIGGGYEPDAHYSHWRRIHQSIEKRQTFHESLIKMLEGQCLHVIPELLYNLLSSLCSLFFNYIVFLQFFPLCAFWQLILNIFFL